MIFPYKSEGLGSPGIASVLKAAVGRECIVTATAADGLRDLTGRISRLEGGRVVVQLSTPAPLPDGDRVQVQLSAPMATWESVLLARLNPSELLLSYPLWCSRADRRDTQRVTLDLPCRYGLAVDYGTAWYSGTIIDMSIGGVRLVGPANISVKTYFLLRLSVPEHPVPLLLHAQSVWSSLLGSRFAVGAEFRDLSMQAETALASGFGLSGLQTSVDGEE